MPTLKGKWYFKENIEVADIGPVKVDYIYNDEYNANDGAKISTDIQLRTLSYYVDVSGGGQLQEVYVYENDQWVEDYFRLIEFMSEQTVSEEFYNWFTKNAVPLNIEGTWRFNTTAFIPPTSAYCTNLQGSCFHKGLNQNIVQICVSNSELRVYTDETSSYLCWTDQAGWAYGENHAIITFCDNLTELDPEFAIWFYENAHSMKLKLYSECYIAETADKIRECVNDNTLTFKVSDLADGVQTAYDAGYSQGIAAVESKGIYKHEVKIDCLTLPDFSTTAIGYLTFYNSDSSSYSYGTSSANIPPNDVIGATILWDGGIEESSIYTIESFDGSKFTMTDGTELMIDSPGEIDDSVTQIGVSSDISLQAKTVNPSASKQTVTADDGYDGLSSVTVNGISYSGTKIITSTGYTTVAGYQYAVVSDSDLVESNIKSGVSILGVSGTFTGDGPSTATVQITAAGTYFNEGEGFEVTYYTNGKACFAYATIHHSLMFQADMGTDVIIHSLIDTIPSSSDFEFVWPDSGEDLTFTVTGDGIMDISTGS